MKGKGITSFILHLNVVQTGISTCSPLHLDKSSDVSPEYSILHSFEKLNISLALLTTAAIKNMQTSFDNLTTGIKTAAGIAIVPFPKGTGSPVSEQVKNETETETPASTSHSHACLFPFRCGWKWKDDGEGG
jgi:hypothetical protein